MSYPIVTFSLFRYNSTGARWRAFVRMGLRSRLKVGESGHRFSKMLGHGGGRGFTVWPNFGVYALMATWDSAAAAESAMATHPFFEQLYKESNESWTAFMQPLLSHGDWDGSNPFAAEVTQPSENQAIAVLTRANIRPAKWWSFWTKVAPVSAAVHEMPGLLFTAGVGEWPIIQQATISVWRSEKHMKAYAYQNAAHMEVIKRTRTEKWYSEELFCRFALLSEKGTWGGKPLLD